MAFSCTELVLAASVGTAARPFHMLASTQFQPRQPSFGAGQSSHQHIRADAWQSWSRYIPCVAYEAGRQPVLVEE